MRKRVLSFVGVAMGLTMFGLIPVNLVSAGSRPGALGTPTRVNDVVAPVGKQLFQARRATAQYRDIGEALGDGYQNIDVFAPGQGCHYLNADLLDGTFDHKRPELLAYAESPGRDPLLVGVEYAVPISESPGGPPEGFAGDFDVWSQNEDFQLWTLHAWIYLPSPDGVFVSDNPLAPQVSQGCGADTSGTRV